MIANQSNIVSLRGYYRKKSLKTSPPPDLSLACVSPYAARAGCGRQTCSYREGTRSSPRSSRGGTWCAPWGTSGACSPGRSRGRSAVGRRHLEFQVASLRPGMGWGGGGKRGRPKGQQINGSSWADCPGWYERNRGNLLPRREGRRFQPAAGGTGTRPRQTRRARSGPRREINCGHHSSRRPGWLENWERLLLINWQFAFQPQLITLLMPLTESFLLILLQLFIKALESNRLATLSLVALKLY